MHLIDRSLDLYGAELSVAFLARLRPERKFPSADALVARHDRFVTRLTDRDPAAELAIDAAFLRALVPEKSPAELYTALGLHKHGKTLFYRELFEHLGHSTDRFIAAPGVRGLVIAAALAAMKPVDTVDEVLKVALAVDDPDAFFARLSQSPGNDVFDESAFKRRKSDRAGEEEAKVH